jgi:N-dimethylarginine dimethylaminohydrolase
MTEVMTKDVWMTATTCETLQHVYTWTDGDGDAWTGIPVWLLVGRVDDDNAHGDEAFNRELAATGYQVSFVASDGYHKELDSTLIAENNEIIVAYLLNGEALPEDKAPLRVVGEVPSSGHMVSMLESIELIFP